MKEDIKHRIFKSKARIFELLGEAEFRYQSSFGFSEGVLDWLASQLQEELGFPQEEANRIIEARLAQLRGQK